MSNNPPRRGEQRPASGGARRSTPPSSPGKTNRASSLPPRQPRRDEQYDQYDQEYDQYEQDEQPVRRPQQGARNNTQGQRRSAPPRNNAPPRYGQPSRYGPPARYSQYSRYDAPRRDAFPMIMGGLVGALIVGLLIVGYMLMSRNNGTASPAVVDNISAGQPTVALNADTQGQATAAAMQQSTVSSVNVPGTETMAAKRPAGGLGTPMPDEGNAHVSDGQVITYKNYPPSSGTHYSSPADAGYYTATVPEGKFVHSLEHGYIVLYYKPDLPDATKQQVKDLMTKLPNGKYGKVKIVIVPYTNMSTPLAIAAWDRILFLKDYNFEEIQAFYQQYVDKGPEDVP